MNKLNIFDIIGGVVVFSIIIIAAFPVVTILAGHVGLYDLFG